MYLNIHMLEIANGLKDALIHADFTIESILNRGPGEIASTMGIDPCVAKIIFNVAKKAVKANGFMQKKVIILSNQLKLLVNCEPDILFPLLLL
jgi:hypothetical protein